MSIYWKWYALVLVTVDWFIVFIGVAGNIVILVSLTKYKPIRNSITKFLFINLTISDLGVLVIRHSFKSVQLYMKGRWIFGEILCKVVAPISSTVLTVSILTMVAISYHRYRCIVGLLKSPPSMRRTVVTVVVIWVSVFGLYAGLDIPFRELDKETQRCKDTVSRMKYVIFVISEKAFYVICFACILYMFSKMKKVLKGILKIQEDSNIERRFSASAQTLRILEPTVFVLLLTLCPAWVINTIAFLSRRLSLSQRYLMYHVVGILMVFNSAANPFLYVIMSRSFKKSFTQILHPFCKIFRYRQQHSRSHRLAMDHALTGMEKTEVSIKTVCKLSSQEPT